ncbi:hypothetical protein BDZ89DRAFT_1077551 [Hymenopellis radicata]|nr:hypothetical protein BDZ89DRAFT_1077551 [Hymenopellis radicata]
MAIITARSSPPSDESTTSSTIIVVIVLSTISATYIAAVLLYYIVCFTQAIREKRLWLMTIEARSDLLAAPEVHTLARALTEKPLDLVPDEDIYSIPARRTKLFRRIFTARRCSAFSMRKILHFTPSPLRHVLFTREDFLDDVPPHSPILSVLVRLQEIAGENVQVLASEEEFKPPYKGMYRWGSVTYTLGKPIKGVCGPHIGGKENQPIPSALLQEPMALLVS